MPPPGAGWTLTFEDDFNGVTLDPIWVKSTADANISLGNSILTVAAYKMNQGYIYNSIHSGFTKQRFSYGYCEFRARHGQPGPGVWSALWHSNAQPTAGFSVSEIDTQEWVGQAGKEMQLQSNYHEWSPTHVQYHQAIDLGFDPSADYHVWACEWSPTFVKWYVDNALVRTLNITTGSKPMNIFIQHQLNYDVAYESWAGLYAEGQTPWPNYLYVDWVRLWQKLDWRGYARLQLTGSYTGGQLADYEQGLKDLGCWDGNLVGPNYLSHIRRVSGSIQDAVVEYASEAAWSKAQFVNALCRYLGVTEVEMDATLTVTTYAGSTWDERRAACKAALGL